MSLNALEKYHGKIVNAGGHESTQTNWANNASPNPMMIPTTIAPIPKNRDRYSRAATTILNLMTSLTYLAKAPVLYFPA